MTPQWTKKLCCAAALCGAMGASAAPMTFVFAWGNAQADVTETIERSVDGVQQKIVLRYTLQRQPDGDDVVLVRSVPQVQSLNDVAVSPDQPPPASVADLIQPLPTLRMGTDGTLRDEQQAAQPLYTVPAASFVQQTMAEYWCQWSCPWAGLTLTPNVALTTPLNVQYIHARDVSSDTVLYSGLYQKGPLHAVSYERVRPFSGEEVARMMPKLTAALGHEHVLSARDQAAIATLSGEQRLRIQAEVMPDTSRPSHVRSVHTLSMVDLKAQPHVATETHDFRFNWTP